MGSLGIAPKRDCTHFLKIGFVVARGWFYSCYIYQGYKYDKERKIVRNKLSLKMGALPLGCNSTSTEFVFAGCEFTKII